MIVKEIITSRLIVRPFTSEDYEAFYNIMKDKDVNQYLPWYVLVNVAQAKEMLEQNYIHATGFHYAICLKEDNVPIGYINVGDDEAHDFGYGLRKEFWHQGIVSEACLSVLKHIKNKIPYITATHDVNNIHSGNVMKKLGLTYQYSYKERWMPKDINVTFRMYQLNFDNRQGTYLKYWNMYEEHFIEDV